MAQMSSNMPLAGASTAAPVNMAYFIVSPSPLHEGNYVVGGGRPGYFIKIGDGDPSRKYSTHNPSYWAAANIHCPSATTSSWSFNRELHEYVYMGEHQPGKALQYRFLKYRDQEVSARSEWYFVQLIEPDPDGSQIEKLRLQLGQLLAEFTDYNVWATPAADRLDSHSAFGIHIIDMLVASNVYYSGMERSNESNVFAAM